MKTDRYTQIYLHVILKVVDKIWMTGKEEESEFYSLIRLLVNRLDHKLLAINGIPGHLHLLLEFNPRQSPEETIRVIKQESAGFVNARRWLPEPFRWEAGYGAFTYSASQIGKAREYIRNQVKFHEREKELADGLSLTERSEQVVHGGVLFDFTDV